MSAISRASVAGLQLTYMISWGLKSRRMPGASGCIPARGGSTTMTSGDFSFLFHSSSSFLLVHWWLSHFWCYFLRGYGCYPHLPQEQSQQSIPLLIAQRNHTNRSCARVEIKDNRIFRLYHISRDTVEFFCSRVFVWKNSSDLSQIRDQRAFLWWWGVPDICSKFPCTTSAFPVLWRRYAEVMAGIRDMNDLRNFWILRVEIHRDRAYSQKRSPSSPLSFYYDGWRGASRIHMRFHIIGREPIFTSKSIEKHEIYHSRLHHPRHNRYNQWFYQIALTHEIQNGIYHRPLHELRYIFTS